MTIISEEYFQKFNIDKNITILAAMYTILYPPQPTRNQPTMTALFEYIGSLACYYYIYIFKWNRQISLLLNFASSQYGVISCRKKSLHTLQTTKKYLLYLIITLAPFMHLLCVHGK